MHLDSLPLSNLDSIVQALIPWIESWEIWRCQRSKLPIDPWKNNGGLKEKNKIALTPVEAPAVLANATVSGEGNLDSLGVADNLIDVFGIQQTTQCCKLLSTSFVRYFDKILPFLR